MPKKDKGENTDKRFDKYGKYSQTVLSLMIELSSLYREAEHREKGQPPRRHKDIDNSYLPTMVDMTEKTLDRYVLLNALPRIMAYSKDYHEGKESQQVALFSEAEVRDSEETEKYLRGTDLIENMLKDFAAGRLG